MRGIVTRRSPEGPHGLALMDNLPCPQTGHSWFRNYQEAVYILKYKIETPRYLLTHLSPTSRMENGNKANTCFLFYPLERQSLGLQSFQTFLQVVTVVASLGGIDKASGSFCP